MMHFHKKNNHEGTKTQRKNKSVASLFSNHFLYHYIVVNKTSHVKNLCAFVPEGELRSKRGSPGGSWFKIMVQKRDLTCSV